MKKVSKKISSLVLVFVLMLGMIPAVYAATGTAEKDGLYVELKTDKDSYTSGETIKTWVVTKNKGTEELTNIKVQVTAPEGVKLEGDGIVTVAALKAGEEKEQEVKATTTAPANTNTGTDTNANSTANSPNTADAWVWVLFAMVFVAGGVMLLLFGYKQKKLSGKILGAIALVVALGSASIPSTVSAAVLSGSFELSVTVKVDGKDKVIVAKITYGEASNTESGDNTGSQPSESESQPSGGGDQPSGGGNQPSGGGDQPSGGSTDIKRVSVHDPSIVKEGDTYYIFGSHMAWAKSTDLVNWESFTNNINTDYETLFADGAAWSKQGDPDYKLVTGQDGTGNLWAPDIIWNDTMNKWCMYMSVNGNSWNSSIALLTADHLDGNWEYKGTVIYSGFTKTSVNNFTGTDYTKVTGESELADRYVNTDGSWKSSYGAHAIDPCVLDDNGKLYMTYGSWSGGIYMIELDESTGLRDDSVTYTYDANRSDPYMGKKLAGGLDSSGEASYIEKIGDNYYLFVTYGVLTARGGYNMRVFKSTTGSIAGPYEDPSGQSSRNNGGTSNTEVGSINGPVGERLMSYYKWSFMDLGYCAQGHNSAFVDDDGKAYIVYHTRFNNGMEWHQVRVHQVFVNEDGWLVTAPFEYRGETLSTEGYTKDQVAGTYEVLFQESTDFANLECVQGIDLALNEDGTISGGKTGTWSWSAAKGSPYVDMVLDGVTYRGVFLEQNLEESNEKAYTFTVLGVNGHVETNVWGYRKAAAATGEAITVTSAKSGTAYADAESTVKVTFTTDDTFAGDEVIKVNNTTVSAVNDSASSATVASITREDKKVEVELKIPAVSGWHAIENKAWTVTMQDAALRPLGEAQTFEYSLDGLSPGTAYTKIATAANDYSSAYYKIDGNKMYFMTIIKSNKIHCDKQTAGGTTYEWWNGINSELYMTLAKNSKKYSVGSHVYFNVLEGNYYANAVGWGKGTNSDEAAFENDLILEGNEKKVVRGYVSYGTFDNDDDTDMGCILLNVVDFTDAGLTAGELSGTTFTLSGYLGANDGGLGWVTVDATQTYTFP